MVCTTISFSTLLSLILKTGLFTTKHLTSAYTSAQFFRDDYSAEVNDVYMRQAIFVTVKRGYALVFSFTEQDQKSVEEMAKTMETILPIGRGGGVGPGSTSERKPN